MRDLIRLNYNYLQLLAIFRTLRPQHQFLVCAQEFEQKKPDAMKS